MMMGARPNSCRQTHINHQDPHPPLTGRTSRPTRYIESHSTITEPLRKLTRNSQKWQRGNDQNKAFNKLKEKLTQVGVMEYFDPKKETEILVDASPCGLTNHYLES
ncbi:Pol protein [Elysia marginata]|uniref:Pol protein n=1 Tax=Elysia marginata TaxID=1093978 RepID=A0AAV4G3U6_9GAST|nr:Pol protein [Elysia marginata]